MLCDLYILRLYCFSLHIWLYRETVSQRSAFDWKQEDMVSGVQPQNSQVR